MWFGEINTNMKILFICDPGLDYGEYMLFNGLCNVLGEQNVVTYPFKGSYYGQIDHDYQLENLYTTGSKGYTAPEENMVIRFVNYWNKEKILENFDVFDLIILASCRIVAVNALRELKKERDFSQPLIIHESEDYEDIRVDLVNEFKPTLYFKRTLRKDGKNNFLDKCSVPVIPCPLSAILNSAPFENDKRKMYSVWYINGDTHPIRSRVYDNLLYLNYPNMICKIISHERMHTWYDKISYKNYMITIARSKIAVAPRGWSFDAQKRVEIPIYNTLLFTNEISYVTPNDFTDGKNYAVFNTDLSDFKEKTGLDRTVRIDALEYVQIDPTQNFFTHFNL